jgi:hypothetical protein
MIEMPTAEELMSIACPLKVCDKNMWVTFLTKDDGEWREMLVKEVLFKAKNKEGKIYYTVIEAVVDGFGEELWYQYRSFHVRLVIGAVPYKSQRTD